MNNFVFYYNTDDTIIPIPKPFLSEFFITSKKFKTEYKYNTSK